MNPPPQHTQPSFLCQQANSAFPDSAKVRKNQSLVARFLRWSDDHTPKRDAVGGPPQHPAKKQPIRPTAIPSRSPGAVASRKTPIGTASTTSRIAAASVAPVM